MKTTPIKKNVVNKLYISVVSTISFTMSIISECSAYIITTCILDNDLNLK